MSTATTAPPPPSFQTALVGGALAGTTVDLTLFPLDTLKTRLQAAEGFFAAGGFRGVYRGVGSAVVGSAPGAAFFFCTYETAKDALAKRRRRRRQEQLELELQQGSGKKVKAKAKAKAEDADALALEATVDHMVAASLGEVAACAVRVPTEVVKQRAQAGQAGGSSRAALAAILRGPAVWRELYRGFGATVMREVPFTALQFPLWEALKARGRARRERTGRGLFGDLAGLTREVAAPESALYGSLAGAVAAGVTTPLDVLKTRVMLSRQRVGMLSIVRSILREHGVRPFFAGIGPRVMWISIGGAVFLGSYQWTVNALESGLIFSR